MFMLCGSCNDRCEEEKKRLWNGLGHVVNAVGKGYRLVVLGDVYGIIGDGVRGSVTGSVDVPGENENEMKVVDFCSRGICVTNTFFQHKDIYKYTWVGQGGESECRSMTHLIWCKRIC